jgi:hypothetical protein
MRLIRCRARAANKVTGVRAALAYNLEIARLAREHNDANVIGLGARMHPQDNRVYPPAGLRSKGSTQRPRRTTSATVRWSPRLPSGVAALTSRGPSMAPASAAAT